MWPRKEKTPEQYIRDEKKMFVYYLFVIISFYLRIVDRTKQMCRMKGTKKNKFAELNVCYNNWCLFCNRGVIYWQIYRVIVLGKCSDAKFVMLVFNNDYYFYNSALMIQSCADFSSYSSFYHSRLWTMFQT